MWTFTMNRFTIVADDFAKARSAEGHITGTLKGDGTAVPGSRPWLVNRLLVQTMRAGI